MTEYETERGAKIARIIARMRRQLEASLVVSVVGAITIEGVLCHGLFLTGTRDEVRAASKLWGERVRLVPVLDERAGVEG
jgi:hypothetical protein